ncbi:putative lipid II flippase FtsW [Collinsella sp. AGMB00827]|uniref:Probable peptidoglycan glycosyltransferase FtsW n=1 Tax=Collinsella ureilytica TaxID=2869515 RepID=A0ABS7MHV3_9ACTN|nr:putative lipid II flippase FtsW [Collinsella urealyticum]MBY4796935.1 putative lipid II flippase FtsW [Collinsella urealyticum]
MAGRKTEQPDQTSREQRRKPATGSPVRAVSTGAKEHLERMIAGVPARIMAPRLVFIACLSALVLFGLLMVYSASAVEALQEQGSSTYFLLRQLLFAAVGVIGAVIVAKGFVWTLKSYRAGGFHFLYLIIVGLLILVLIIGRAAGGAQRWINLGFFSLQPSEFAKPVILLGAADSLARYYEERSIDVAELLKDIGIRVLLPLALIFFEPDAGSTMIIMMTVFTMAVLSGLSGKFVAGLVIGIVAIGAVVIVAEPYRFERLLVVWNPWADPYGSGYQATLAIMAFASGGLFGRGIGNATMKYNYLPEAHNDYILAIIGEELGFIGTVIFLLVFMAMVFAAFKIARQSRTLYGRLIAAGGAVILCLQFFVNVLGIVGLAPMTGKTLPFISYGGSSMIASLIIAGLILLVSRESEQESPYRDRREGFAVMGDGGAAASVRMNYGDEPEMDGVSAHAGRSTAGLPHRRSQAVSPGAGGTSGTDPSGFSERSTAGSGRGRARSSRSNFAVYEGDNQGGSTRARSRSRHRSGTRDVRGVQDRAPRSRSASGWERIDLHAGPASRLRRPGGEPRRRDRRSSDTWRSREDGSYES